MKLVMKDPIKPNEFDFRAGGTGVPILTRASASSTTGYQTMGLNNGSKTILGAIRMGDDDGNGPPSVVFPGVYEQPIVRSDIPDVEKNLFASSGNRVYQPDDTTLATVALLKRLGDQRFKAESQAPFEDYLAQQKVANMVEEASRGASLADLGTSREIMRNLAAQRRQQNEDDYLRKMLDSGATPEAARQEIENVRNSNAIQEARKVDDREYQAKTLISRIAMSRGVTPMVREPLNQSASIDNPQRSQAMSQAMGMPGEGFGTSPLDANRVFMNPDFYKKFLRKSAMTQEATDEQTAFSNLMSELPEPSSGAYSLATIKGQEREMQIDNATEALAARLEVLRQRGTRIKLPLPKPILVSELLGAIYKQKTKKAGDKVIYTPESINDMNVTQLLLALNFFIQLTPTGIIKLRTEVKKYDWGTEIKPSANLLRDLRKVAYSMNKDDMNTQIPFANTSMRPSNSSLVKYLNNIKGTDAELDKEARAGSLQLNNNLAEMGETLKPSDYEIIQ
jgi:hypothetical protein